MFAFKDGTTNFSKDNALLSGAKTGLKVNGEKIEVIDTIWLSVYASSKEKGTVSLKIKVPDGCSLEIEEKTSDGETVSAENVHFIRIGDSPNFTVTQKNENGIPAGTYSVIFTVKKVDETDNTKEEIIYIFPESINVLPGMHTDTWWNGATSSATKIITQDMFSSTVYVRGKDSLWYASNAPNATADDKNSGSFLSPLATIQKVVDTIIARNDGSSEYTIFVDGTLECDENTYIGRYGMADFSALKTNLNLTIKALSGTATLDGGARFDADGNVEDGKNGIEKRIIYVPSSGVCNLALENLVITGGYGISQKGGGIYFNSLGGKLTISGNTKINGNRAFFGGGICVDSSTFTMTGGTISDCTARQRGGGVYIESAGTFNMSGTAEITGCKTTLTDSNLEGGGIYSEGALTITGGTISNCTSGEFGGGVFIRKGMFTMTGGTISENIAKYGGGGVYLNGGTFTMEYGTISKNIAGTSGGGVSVGNGPFTMSGGTISGNEASTNGGGVWITNTFTMNGGTISGNTATGKGGGVYHQVGAFNMSDAAKVESDNDVYLSENKTICVTGELTARSPVATITPAAYTENRPLLTAGENVTLSGGICGKFAVTPQNNGDGTDTEWRCALDGANGVLIRKYVGGDAGPGGGVVLLYDVNGFAVNGKTCHYLEGSKEPVRTVDVTWCPCSSDYCEVTTSDDIGAGYANTQAILNHPNHASATSSNCAAKACAEYKTDTTAAGEWFCRILMRCLI